MKELNFPLFVLLTACRMSPATEGNYIEGNLSMQPNW